MKSRQGPLSTLPLPQVHPIGLGTVLFPAVSPREGTGTVSVECALFTEVLPCIRQHAACSKLNLFNPLSPRVFFPIEEMQAPKVRGDLPRPHSQESKEGMVPGCNAVPCLLLDCSGTLRGKAAHLLLPRHLWAEPPHLPSCGTYHGPLPALCPLLSSGRTPPFSLCCFSHPRGLVPLKK